MKNAGGVFGYAGTTPERAQETLDVSLGEIEHLVEDLQELSLAEAKEIRIKTAPVDLRELLDSAFRAVPLPDGICFDVSGNVQTRKTRRWRGVLKRQPSLEQNMSYQL